MGPNEVSVAMDSDRPQIDLRDQFHSEMNMMAVD
jgi:hypothetical protein